MSVKFSLGPSQIKHFKNALQCLARIGSEVLVEAVPDKLVLRCINSAKSAFMAVTFHAPFFDTFSLFHSHCVQTAVLMKNLLATFRTPKVARMAVEATTDAGDPRLSIALTCDNGLAKRYVLHCVEAEILQTTVDRDAFPTSVVAEAAELNKLLASFHSSLEEITIIANPQDPQQGAGAGGEGSRGVCELRSFLDPARGLSDKALKTAVAVNTEAVFRGYRHDAEGASDVTFNLRDLRAIVALCEALGANLWLAFDQPGVPLLAQPHFGGAEAVDYEGELVLATLMESQMDTDPPPPPQNHPEGAAAGAGRLAGGATTSYIPGDTPWRGDGGRTPMSRAGGPGGQTPAGMPWQNGNRGTARPSRLAQSTFSGAPQGPAPAAGPPPRPNPHITPPPAAAAPGSNIRFNTQHTAAANGGNFEYDGMEEDGAAADQAAAHSNWAAPGAGASGGRGTVSFQLHQDEEGGQAASAWGMEEEEEEEEDEMPPTPPEKRLRSAGPGIISTLP